MRQLHEFNSPIADPDVADGIDDTVSSQSDVADRMCADFATG